MNVGLFRSNGRAFQDRKDKLLADFVAMAGKAQDLMQDTASSAGSRLDGVRMRLGDAGTVAAEKARYAAACTGRFAKEKPWAMAGIVAGVAALVGFILSRR